MENKYNEMYFSKPDANARSQFCDGRDGLNS